MIAPPGYQIECEVGRGSSAVVYRAEQLSLGRTLALKVLLPSLAGDAGMSAQFLAQGRIAARLRHRHIVPVIDVGVSNAAPYLAMAWLPGGTLAQQALPLPLARVQQLGQQLASALAHAHSTGVVHNDIKPANVLIDADGAFVLADFGSANFNPQATPQWLAGTPAFVAPERWRGEPVDGRTDLYSLGVLLYYCLVGKLPFAATATDALREQHLYAPAPPLPASFTALQPILDRLLAKNPSARFATAQELLQSFAPAPLAPAPAAPPEHPAPLLAPLFVPTTKPVWPRAALLGACAALAITAALLWNRGAPLAPPALSTPPLAVVAVMPCTTLDPQLKATGEALMSELIFRLARLRDLSVIARSASFTQSASSQLPDQIAARLGATHLVACDLRAAPAQLRIQVELIEAKHNHSLWTATFDPSPAEVLQLVDTLALQISERVLDQLAGGARANLMRRGARSAEALAEVDRAIQLLAAPSAAGFAQSALLLERAEKRDPEFVGIWIARAQRVDALAQAEHWPYLRWVQQMQPLAQTALALDERAPGALLLRASLACRALQWAACEVDLRQALRMAPSDESTLAANAEFARRRQAPGVAIDAAQTWVRHAPDSPDALAAWAWALLQADANASALTLAQAARQQTPDHLGLKQAHAFSLRLKGSCQAALRIAGLDANGAIEPWAATIAACAGRHSAVQLMQRDLVLAEAQGDWVDPMTVARVALATAQNDAALDALDALVDAHDLRVLDLLNGPYPELSALHASARYSALRARLELPAGRSK